MTITLHPSKQRLASVDIKYGATDSKHLLENSYEDAVSKIQSPFAVFSSNVPTEPFSATDLSKSVIDSVIHRNGLVHTALLAYCSHHHLVMRPDDVWVTILSQFHRYVNANAEKLRHLFEDHELVIDVEIRSTGTFRYIYYGTVADQMAKVMQEKVKDPELREWIFPDFSTSTEVDAIVSSVVMHTTYPIPPTVDNCFDDELSFLSCGLPAVTLLGVKADWENLLVKADKLPSYGDETAQWHSLLKPVLAAFVRSFDEPDSDRTKDFWQSIAHQTGGGSGPTWLSGWITAFCFFDSAGKPLYRDTTVGKAQSMGRELPCFEMDGIGYHRVDTTKVPPAYAGVDVQLDEYGEKSETIMVVGVVGMEITSSGIRVEDHEGKDDTVRPVASWWLLEKK